MPIEWNGISTRANGNKSTGHFSLLSLPFISFFFSRKYVERVNYTHNCMSSDTRNRIHVRKVSDFRDRSRCNIAGACISDVASPALKHWSTMHAETKHAQILAMEFKLSIRDYRRLCEIRDNCSKRESNTIRMLVASLYRGISSLIRLLLTDCIPRDDSVITDILIHYVNFTNTIKHGKKCALNLDVDLGKSLFRHVSNVQRNDLKCIVLIFRWDLYLLGHACE